MPQAAPRSDPPWWQPRPQAPLTPQMIEAADAIRAAAGLPPQQRPVALVAAAASPPALGGVAGSGAGDSGAEASSASASGTGTSGAAASGAGGDAAASVASDTRAFAGSWASVARSPTYTSLVRGMKVRLSLVRSMKARSDHYLAVLNLVRLWCHPYDRSTVIRVMGVIKLAVKDKERWLLGLKPVPDHRLTIPAGSGAEGAASSGA